MFSDLYLQLRKLNYTGIIAGTQAANCQIVKTRFNANMTTDTLCVVSTMYTKSSNGSYVGTLTTQPVLETSLIMTGYYFVVYDNNRRAR